MQVPRRDSAKDAEEVLLGLSEYNADGCKRQHCDVTEMRLTTANDYQVIGAISCAHQHHPASFQTALSGFETRETSSVKSPFSVTTLGKTPALDRRVPCLRMEIADAQRTFIHSSYPPVISPQSNTYNTNLNISWSFQTSFDNIDIGAGIQNAAMLCGENGRNVYKRYEEPAGSPPTYVELSPQPQQPTVMLRSARNTLADELMSLDIGCQSSARSPNTVQPSSRSPSLPFEGGNLALPTSANAVHKMHAASCYSWESLTGQPTDFIPSPASDVHRYENVNLNLVC
jgi:hypothetical protein